MYIVEINLIGNAWLRKKDAEFESLEEALDYIHMQEDPEKHRVIKVVAKYEVETKLLVNE